MQETVQIRQRIAQKTANKVNKLKSNFDTQGSYTGVNIDNEYEIPVQDADDL